MLDKQQKQIDRLSKAKNYTSSTSSNTYSNHKSESTTNYQVTCYKCGGKGRKRPKCPSPFQAQRSDEDEQKPHTNVQVETEVIVVDITKEVTEVKVEEQVFLVARKS